MFVTDDAVLDRLASQIPALEDAEILVDSDSEEEEPESLSELVKRSHLLREPGFGVGIPSTDRRIYPWSAYDSEESEDGE
ncbi:hypothetical protein Hypma_010750 [Hypsizygus marmoreus]|uniref:Uncharacterized protein n=1 Tax=Hypsizygus marmoreus TaxID=39966 RepID=A0A369JR30_HYPMA|nr:hypothetical protein Hypma_010750 [Hypsizygus marmoreus]